MKSRYSRAALTLAIVAMVLRALLPMGWMPNPEGFAESPLVICLMDTPSGLDVHQAMDMSHDMDMSKMDMSNMDMPGQGQGQGHDHGQQQSSEPCPFAAAPHIAASGGLITKLAPPSLLARLSETPSPEAGLALDPAYHPHSPRAPPSFA
jgi:hypothetical protein